MIALRVRGERPRGQNCFGHLLAGNGFLSDCRNHSVRRTILNSARGDCCRERRTQGTDRPYRAAQTCRGSHIRRDEIGYA